MEPLLVAAIIAIIAIVLVAVLRYLRQRRAGSVRAVFTAPGDERAEMTPPPGDDE
ncbi:hypothetical protein BH24CHL5_BH24CHL5_03010 [soil metagenome]